MTNEDSNKYIHVEKFKREYEATVKGTFEEEIADTMIRIFDLAGGMGIALEDHIHQKIRYNETRDRLHGKKY